MARRYRKTDNSLEKLLQGISLFIVLSLVSLWYANRAMFATWISFCITSALTIVVGAIAWSQFRLLSKQKRLNSLLSTLKQANLEGDVENFINRFGFEKNKRNWSFRNHSFDWERLKDFRKFLHDKGVGISTESWSDTILLLRHYIQRKEEHLTVESISIAPRRFADLSGTDFETLLFRLFTAMGYAVQKTGKTGDQGGDLIINKNQQRTLIQAKCYKHISVGNAAIQEAVAAQKYYDCTSATVVTNSEFTKEAIELAKVNKVGLIGAVRLRELLLQCLKESWN